ncbi:hypothetical protein CHELA20_51208 [Hyphomicrobiales bacterium]|nr:hypothetical protein CHELA41_23804 [Hyphomicrobiales bacterium]CAH1674445.1 hypothetical protein CHELA20_51208 [Hyphomicrobiales bacterium]
MDPRALLWPPPCPRGPPPYRHDTAGCAICEEIPARELYNNPIDFNSFDCFVFVQVVINQACALTGTE